MIVVTGTTHHGCFFGSSFAEWTVAALQHRLGLNCWRLAELRAPLDVLLGGWKSCRGRWSTKPADAPPWWRATLPPLTMRDRRGR